MIEVKDLYKSFKLYSKPSDRLKEKIFRKNYHKIHQALNGINFRVEDGQTLGIIGQNGAGKSTLLKLLMNVIMPDSGEIITSGKITGLLELGTGFNYEMTGLKNIYMNGMLLGMTKDEIDAKKDAIINFSELGYFIDEPIKTYSSGMVMRLAFSIAIHASPSCFLVDEALSVGDAYFQQKCMKKIKEFRKSGGSIIFVSHDMNAIKMLCDKAILLDKGQIIEMGTPEQVVNKYNFLISKINDNEDKMILKSNGEQTHYGNYEMRILDAKVYGTFSKCDTVSSGEKTIISIKYESKIATEDVTVGIMIRDKFGQDIYGINTFMLDKRIKVQADKSYECKFVFDIDIAPGKYTLTAALHSDKWHTENCYYWVDNICTFEVIGFVKNMFGGVTNLNAECQVEEV